MANYSDTLNIVKDYVSSIGESPAQRTAEWYDIRKFTIGGSEIATVLGLNPFESVKSLVAKKVNIGFSFNGNTATRWGNLFESVTQQFTELLFKMPNTMFSLGSIKGVIDGQRYSPDGLGVVRMLRSDNIKDNFIVLFEFKSPLRSLPLGTIPKHYKPQVQTGLLSINIAEFAIFVNCCYRKCTIQDLTFNSVYDVDFHNGDDKKRKSGLTNEVPYAIGVCCFYQTTEQYELAAKSLGYSLVEYSIDNKIDNKIDDEVNDVVKKTDFTYKTIDGEILLRSQIIDFGCNKSYIDRLLYLLDNKKLSTKYLPMTLNANKINNMKITTTHNIKHTTENINYYNYIEEFKKHCESNKLIFIGYLPWKLMLADVLIETRDDNWLEKIQQPVLDTIATIKEIASAIDPLEAYQKKYNITNEVGDYSDML
jgi:hypothetical protein